MAQHGVTFEFKDRSPGRDIKVPTRRFDPVLAGRARNDFARRAREAGRGFFNRANTGLRSRGLGRNAAVLGIGQEAAQVESGVSERLNLPFALGEQEFTESARRFDTQTELALRQLFLQNKELQKKYGFSFGAFMGSLLGAGATVGATAIGGPAAGAATSRLV